MTRVFDATGCVLGRLASATAETLQDGEEVAIVNAEKAIVTGSRENVMERYREKYQRGTQRKGPFFPRVPDRLVKRTVRGMLPYKKASGRQAFERLRCYIGVPDQYQDADPETPEKAKPKSVTSSVEIAEISRHLGAKV